MLKLLSLMSAMKFSRLQAMLQSFRWLDGAHGPKKPGIADEVMSKCLMGRFCSILLSYCLDNSEES